MRSKRNYFPSSLGIEEKKMRRTSTSDLSLTYYSFQILYNDKIITIFKIILIILLDNKFFSFKIYFLRKKNIIILHFLVLQDSNQKTKKEKEKNRNYLICSYEQRL